MPTATQSTTSQARIKRAGKSEKIDVKQELIKLSVPRKEWQQADGRANGLLYNLLGSLFELNRRIGKNKQAKLALQAECSQNPRIHPSKMWKIKERPVVDLLIAYTLGTDGSKAASRSNWKQVLGKASKAGVPPSRKAFSDWLHQNDGIEGVLSNGKQKAPNKAVKFDFAEYSSSIKPMGLPHVTLDLAQAPSYSDESFKNEFALVLVARAIDPETGKTTGCNLIDIVNNSQMIEKAAAIISKQTPKKH
jgi:hypothetical protein